jgi:hypothetical protein
VVAEQQVVEGRAVEASTLARRRRFQRCGACAGCLQQQNCLACPPCLDKASEKPKLHMGCVKRKCQHLAIVRPSVAPVAGGAGDRAGTGQVAGQGQAASRREVAMDPGSGSTLDITPVEVEGRAVEASDLGFARTPHHTFFPAVKQCTAGRANSVQVVFFVTGEAAFVPIDEWKPYTLATSKQLVLDPKTNRGSFSLALSELRGVLAGLEGGEEAANCMLPVAGTSTMLGAARQLGPMSAGRLKAEEAFNAAAFKQKMFLKQNSRWGCHQCPDYEQELIMAAKRHARLCGQRPREPRQRSLAQKYGCSACGDHFSLKSSLHEHYQEMHTERVRALKCNVCRKEFINNRNLVRHWREKHGPEEKRPAFRCPYCSYTTTRKHSLQAIHMPREHSNQVMEAVDQETFGEEDETDDEAAEVGRGSGGEELVASSAEEMGEESDEDESDTAGSSDSDDSYVDDDKEEPGMATINMQIRDLVQRQDTILEGEQRRLKNLKELRAALRKSNIGEAKAAMEEGGKKPARKRRAIDGEPSVAVRKSPRLQLARPVDQDTIEPLATEQVKQLEQVTDNTGKQVEGALTATGSGEVAALADRVQPLTVEQVADILWLLIL